MEVFYVDKHCWCEHKRMFLQSPPTIYNTILADGAV